MSDVGRVDIDELRVAIDRVLNAVEAKYGRRVELDADYYAELDLQLSFDPHADQTKGLGMGQLTDDVQEMRAMVARPDAPELWHDLPHIVGILRRIAALDLPDGASA